MRKLKLDLDRLTVDSFATTPDGDADAGTVHGQEYRPTIKTVCDNTLLATNPTCCPCTPMY